MRTLLRVILVVAMVAAISFGMAACNTFRGAGKDIQRGGEVIQEVAK